MKDFGYFNFFTFIACITFIISSVSFFELCFFWERFDKLEDYFNISYSTESYYYEKGV